MFGLIAHSVRKGSLSIRFDSVLAALTDFALRDGEFRFFLLLLFPCTPCQQQFGTFHVRVAHSNPSRGGEF